MGSQIIKMAAFEEFEKKFLSATKDSFETLALELFELQFQYNPLYQAFCSQLSKTPDQVKCLKEIPFLPIGLFKQYAIKTTDFEAEQIFESSGTGGMIPSRHHVKKAGIYEQSFLAGFKQSYGNPEQWCILGLLPSYLERGQSSLVYMTEQLIQLSGHERSGFYLHDHAALSNVISKNEAEAVATLLIGVTYALIDFSERYSMPLKNTILMETGGMKGRRKELLWQEVHAILQERFHLQQIHSEYGMTELLSQAYSAANGLFKTADTLRILIRSEDNPLEVISADQISQPKRGGVNVIDLANIYSCAFIATDDAGLLYPDGSFEITGRLDSSEARGCSMMVAE